MYKICIDPGHGGTDSGATNGAAYEKNIVLDIAKRVKPLLESSGYEVVMTRETDIFNTPSEKAQIANKAGCDLFVSIHCNSHAQNTANGTETWYYTGSDEGEKLATALQSNLIAKLGLRDRGIKNNKTFAVLNSTKMTAALVEVAFISNPEEKALLINNGFKAHAAQAIADGINEFYGRTSEEDNRAALLAVRRNKVKEAYSFTRETMDYLEAYKYGEALIERLFNKI